MKTIKPFFLSLLAIVILVVMWSFIEPRLIDTEAEVAVIRDLPDAWSEQRVAQISDFQVGLWLDNTGTIDRIVEQIVEERPALVLISGDFIYHSQPNPEKEIEKAIERIRPLTQANIPTYAVLGNHDYSVGSLKQQADQELAAQVKTALEAIGITVLQNEAVELAPPEGASSSDRPLYLAGIGSYLAQQANPKAAIAAVPDGSPRIVMMHHPNSFAALPASTAPLAVAGHTHGGQIRVPFLPAWSWLTYAKEDQVHADGWIDNYGEPGNQLYVNRGIGMSKAPIRLNCQPEVTFFTLRSQ